MKNSPFILSLIAASVLVSSQLVQAQSTPNPTNSTTPAVINTVLLDEHNAVKNAGDSPIIIPLGTTLIVSLEGNDVNSALYCEGSHHGSYWNLIPGGAFNATSTPTSIPLNVPLKTTSMTAIQEKSTTYTWSLIADQTGPTQVTFQKYTFSQPSIWNQLDGDPLVFNIVVVAPNITDLSAAQ